MIPTSLLVLITASLPSRCSCPYLLPSFFLPFGISCRGPCSWCCCLCPSLSFRPSGIVLAWYLTMLLFFPFLLPYRLCHCPSRFLRLRIFILLPYSLFIVALLSLAYVASFSSSSCVPSLISPPSYVCRSFDICIRGCRLRQWPELPSFLLIIFLRQTIVFHRLLRDLRPCFHGGCWERPDVLRPQKLLVPMSIRGIRSLSQRLC